MHKALADFRIEHEKVIFLQFTDGNSCRVNPGDLAKHLTGDDLYRVQQALKIRGDFVKRILPPTVMSIMVAGVIALGVINVKNLSHTFTQNKPEKASKAASQTQVQASSPAASNSAAQPVEAAPVSQTPAAAQPATPAATHSNALQTPAAPVLQRLDSTPAPVSNLTNPTSLPKVNLPAIQVQSPKPLIGR